MSREPRWWHLCTYTRRCSASQREFISNAGTGPTPGYPHDSIANRRVSATQSHDKIHNRAPYSVQRAPRSIDYRHTRAEPWWAALHPSSTLVDRNSHLRRPRQRVRQNQRHLGWNGESRAFGSFFSPMLASRVQLALIVLGNYLRQSTSPSDASPKARYGGDSVRCYRGQDRRCAGQICCLRTLSMVCSKFRVIETLVHASADGFLCRIITHRLSAAFTSLVSPKSSSALTC